MMPSPGLLTDVVLESSLILGAAWLTARALRGGSAAARHLVWTVAVVAVLVLPAATALGPTITVAGLPTWSVGQWRVSPAGVTRSPAPRPEPTAFPEVSPARVGSGAGPAARPLPDDGTPVERPSPETGVAGAKGRDPAASERPGVGAIRSAAVLLTWSSGVALVFLLLGVERWRLWRLKRKSRRVRTGRVHEQTKALLGRLGVRRGVAVHVAPSSLVPVTWGVLVPRILLPTEAEGWPVRRLRTVLLHELAHVRRRDALTQTLATVACALHWFNPLAWLAAKRMREERERAADDLVLASGSSGPAYAEELLDLARTLSHPPRPEMTAVSMARPSRLAERVEAVLDHGRSRREPGYAAIGAAVALGAAAVGLLTAFTPATSSSLPEPRAASGVDTLTDCWRGTGHRSLNVRTREGYREVIREDDRCRASIRVEGRLEFDRDFSRVIGVSPGGRVVIEERTASGERRFVVRGGSGGTPVYEYGERGERVATGEIAEKALRSRMLVLFRFGGVAARERASSMLESGGVAELLAEARAIPPDPVAAVYLDVLLRARRLASEQLSGVAETVRASVGNDRSAGSVLGTLLATQPGVESSPARDAVLEAMASVGSDAEHVDMLLGALGEDARARPELHRLALRSAGRSVGSDADMVRFLSELARRQPAVATDDRYAEAFWRAAATVGSDGEHVRLLRRLTASEGTGSVLLRSALSSARANVGSDGVLGMYLEWTARSFGALLSESGPDTAFRAALDTIGSDAVRTRVTRTVRRAGLDHLLSS